MRNVILERFKEGKKTIGTLTHMKSMTAVEAIGAAGMDYAMIDMEHSPVTIDEASRLITAADAAGSEYIFVLFSRNINIIIITRGKIIHERRIAADELK